MNNTNISSLNGGGNSLNIIRNISDETHHDIILTGTLNGTISSSSFNWNRNNSVLANLQNNQKDLCYIFDSSITYIYYLSKDSTIYSVHPYGIRLIIEYKE